MPTKTKTKKPAAPRGFEWVPFSKGGNASLFCRGCGCDRLELIRWLDGVLAVSCKECGQLSKLAV